ncbi:MAG: hypothetical protein RBS07_17410 [Lentimicrobium sp.]|nr:hypothetical protein [Lentimicrobium sp.]
MNYNITHISGISGQALFSNHRPPCQGFTPYQSAEEGINLPQPTEHTPVRVAHPAKGRRKVLISEAGQKAAKP